MRTFVRGFAGLSAFILSAAALAQAPFTYQGVVKEGAAPLNGAAYFEFKLFTDASGSSQVGSTIAQSNIPVANGLFSTTLDFGPSVWTGADRWLEVSVYGSVISPRQQINGAPYSHSTRGISINAAGNIGIQTAVASALDQQYSTTTPSGNFGFNVWQSFTPSVTGFLTRASFGYIPPGGGTTIWLEVRTGEGFNGALLATSNTINTTGSQLYDFDFASPPTLTAGAKYSLVLKSGNNGQFGQVWRTCSGSNGPYAGGTCWFAASCDLAFATYMSAPTYVLNATTAGNVGIGTPNPSQKLHVVGNILATGTITPSCAKLKENITPMADALDRLSALNAVRFDWTPQEALTRGFTHDLGFIAEDVAKVFPEVVFRDEKGQVLGLDYSRMSAVAVGAIKQLKAENDQLKAEKDAEIAALKARLAAIEAALSKLESTKPIPAAASPAR